MLRRHIGYGRRIRLRKKKEFNERAKEEKKWEEKDRHRDHPEGPPAGC